MSHFLLRTKLFIPTFSDGFIHRSHLVKQLNESLDSKLTIISAPAGFGKTTLLSEWAFQKKIPVAWVTLGPTDNDLSRFLEYLLTALGQVGVEIDKRILSLLQTPAKASVEELISVLINQLSYLEMRIAIVLDDFHHIQLSEIHEALNILTQNLPSNIHLILSTRADPPLPLARLRANRQLTEIRSSDLKFNILETSAFVNQIHKLGLKRKNIQELANHTEGWAVGLQLASIALQGRVDKEAYISEMSGSMVYIADYFADEVLRQQSPQVLEFLIKTSFLTQMNAALCSRVTGETESGRILKELEKENLFVISLDDIQEWFRYHHLFADLLKQRLHAHPKADLSELALRASQWFEEQKLTEEAIYYALKGKLFDRAIQLIEIVAEETLEKSEFSTFYHWMEQIPESILNNHALIRIQFAWVLLVKDQNIEGALRLLENIPVQSINGTRSLAVRSIACVYQKDFDKAMQYTQLAWEQLPEEDQFFRNVTAWNLSALYFMQGDRQNGLEILEDLAKINQNKNTIFRVVALIRQAQVHLQQGGLNRAEKLFQLALEFSGDRPIVCEALLGLGKVHWQRFDLEKAFELLEKCLQVSKFWRSVISIEAFLVLAQVILSQGDPEKAQNFQQKAWDLNQAADINRQNVRFVQLQQAQLWIRQGKISQVRRWVNENDLQTGELREEKQLGSKVMANYEQIILLRLLILEGDLDQAGHLSSRLLSDMQAAGFLEKVIEVTILKALVFELQGEHQQGLDLIQKAIQLARKENFIRPFIEEIAPIYEVVKASAQGEGEQNFVKVILETFPGLKSSPHSTDLIEKLSTREMEVLKLLQTDLKVPEIADELMIAPSTVRSHIKNIYGKLSVHNRYAAVERAKILKLVN
ncbi:MAG: tetratricopeptide repeat protein [Anaerolineaceae bacterium]|nr:tetratricopeptide repeat protein [Anaerolineaceae bacterium]